MYKWDVYEITTKETPIHGVMFRGRIRKYALQNNVNLLTENASDKENVVRFALEHGTSVADISTFLQKLVSDVEVACIQTALENPVLSKMKVNLEDRYTI